MREWFINWEVNWETKTSSPVTRQERGAGIGSLCVLPRVCFSAEHTLQMVWLFQRGQMPLINNNLYEQIRESSPASGKNRAECTIACQLILEESWKEVDMLIREQNILITDQTESYITDSLTSVAHRVLGWFIPSHQPLGKFYLYLCNQRAR